MGETLVMTKSAGLRDLATKLGYGLGCLAAMAALAVGVPILLFGFMIWMTLERTVYSRTTSPDGLQEARVQFDDCGATCGWAKGVYIKSKWLPFDSPHLGCAAFWGDGTNRVRLEWSGNSQLIVHHGFEQRNSYDAAKTCGPISIITRFDPSLVSEAP